MQHHNIDNMNIQTFRNYSFDIPIHLGIGAQIPISHKAVDGPEIKYPVLHVYVTLPPVLRLVGVPGNPLGMGGGCPQVQSEAKVTGTNFSLTL